VIDTLRTVWNRYNVNSGSMAHDYRKAIWGSNMANNEINIPDGLYERLRRVAGADDSSARELVIAVIQREVEWLETMTLRERYDGDAGNERPHLTVAEWQERRQGRPVLHIDFDAAAIIRDEREQREQEWRKRLEL
jgi:hypothetical protein